MLRDVGIFDPRALVSMGVVLIVATVGVFAFALVRTSNELKLLRSADEPTDEETSDDSYGGMMLSGGAETELPSRGRTDAEPKRGANSPHDASIKLDVATVSEQQGEASRKTTSSWQLFGLCSADPTLVGDSSGGTDSNSDEVAVLLARLEEQSRLLRKNDEALRAKDQAIQEKDAEIVRLAEPPARSR